MSFKFRHFEKIVGFFMLTGLIILLVTIIFLGREQKWFDKKLSFRTLFNDGDKLSKGMDVKINGLIVGKVTDIGFDKNNLIEVKFTIYTDFLDKVRSDSYIFKESSSPLGGGYLKVTIGSKDGKSVRMNSLLHSQDSKIVQDLIADDLIAQKKSSFDKIIKNITQLTRLLSSPRGPLIGTLGNLKELTGKLASGKGSLHSLATDNSLYKEILKSLIMVKKITEDMRVFSKTLRDSSPGVKNIISSTEKGLQETTKVMKGLQRYFMIQTEKAAPEKKQRGPMTVIKLDRRSKNY